MESYELSWSLKYLLHKFRAKFNPLEILSDCCVVLCCYGLHCSDAKSENMDALNTMKPSRAALLYKQHCLCEHFSLSTYEFLNECNINLLRHSERRPMTSKRRHPIY